MKNQTVNRFLIFIILFICISANSAKAEVLVIVNKDLDIESISKTTLAEIYINKKTLWDNGDTIRVVLQATGKTHTAFANEIINIPPSKLRKIWRKVIFTGTGNLPKILKTQSDIVKFVSNTKGGIGYIDSRTPHEDVTILTLE